MNVSIISTLLRALLKWWWLIVIAVVVSVGVGYFVRTDQPDIYAATATVLVGQDVRRVQGTSVRSNTDLLTAYSVFVRRSSILQPVIDELNLGIDVNVLNDIMEIMPNIEASLLEITVHDTDAERAALIANRIAQEMMNQSAIGGGGEVGDPEFINRQLRNLQTQIDQLQTEHDELLAAVPTLNSAFELNQNTEERETINNTLQTLQTLYAQYLNSTTEVQRQVQLFEIAVPNYFPIASNSFLDLLIAGAAGGMLAVVTIVLIVFFDDRFQWSEGDDDEVYGVRVLGPLGIVASNKLPFYADTAPESIEAEALRQVRSKIILNAKNGAPPRVITFVSHDSGDGKTLTTSNMALTFARSGERTVVIDGDIRKGDLHELFRLPNVFGISDVLASREPVEDILHQSILQTNFENLALIPAGRAINDPAALLSNDRLEEMIEALKQKFDLVIFDSAPTIAGQDSVFLGEASDGVVIVVNARRTTQRAIKRTIASLREGRNVYLFGLVVNRVRLQITSKYSTTYYRHAPGITAEQLNKELLSPSRLSIRKPANIMINKNGERLYSVEASASRLGVRSQSIYEWQKSGYLKTEKHGFRTWVNESEIERILSSLPVAEEVEFKPKPKAPAPPAESSTNGITARLPVPDQLREQRNAVLGLASKNDNGEVE